MFHKRNNFPTFQHQSTAPPAQLNTNNEVPNNLKTFTSQVEQKTEKFIWEICGFEKIQKLKLWSTPNCNFEVGPYRWNLSLKLSPNEKILIANPELLSPQNTTVDCSIKCQVINQQNFILHSSPFAIEQPGTVSNKIEIGNSKSDASLKWEILRFDERQIIDQFSNLVANDRLRLLIEFSVYIDNNSTSK